MVIGLGGGLSWGFRVLRRMDIVNDVYLEREMERREGRGGIFRGVERGREVRGSSMGTNGEAVLTVI